MKAEQWQKASRIARAALQRAPQERKEFVLAACAGDDALRREVASLLRQHWQMRQFLNAQMETNQFYASSRVQAPSKPAERRLGHYRILQLAGRGNLGKVYFAQDLEQGRRVALKLLLRKAAGDPERVRRFHEEACAASALAHPNIVTVYEAGKLDDVWFLATEVIEGQTLRASLAAGRLSLPAVLELLIQTASALEAAHQAGITHRALKPENIMLNQQGVVKVLDFGAANLLDVNYVQEGNDRLTGNLPAATGAANYLAPEQAAGLRVDKRADIFSLGVILYEMATGQQPFAGATPTDVVAAVLAKDPAPLAQGLPEGLQRLVNRALAKDAEARYQSAQALLADLKALKQELEPVRQTKSTQERRTKPTGSRQKAAGQQRQTPPLSDAAPKARSQARPKTKPVPAQPPAQPPPQAKTSRKTTHSNDDDSLPEVATFMDWQRYTRPPRKRNRKLTLWQRLVQWQKYVLLLAVLLVTLGAVTTYLHSSQSGTDSIAVLPFTYEAPAGANSEYFADGLTESLSQRLAQAASLKVSALDSVSPYQGQEVDVQEIGSTLGVRTVLSGRLSMQGGLLTVRVRLLEASTRAVLWRYQETRESTELLTLQQELLGALARQLHLSDADRRQLSARETEQPQAFLSYLKGRALLAQQSGEAFKNGLEQFRQAVALDPRYARAQAALAECYLRAPQYGEMSAASAIAASREAVARALELDPQLAEAQITHGVLLRKYEWDWAGAEAAFTQALALNEHNAAAHQGYGELLTGLGRFDEAIAELQRAKELAPASLSANLALGAGFYYARRYEAAFTQLQKALELNPTAAEIHAYLGLIYGQQGKPRESLIALQKAITLAQGSNALAARLAHTYVLAEMEFEARKILDDLQELAAPGSVPLTLAAAIRAALGEQEQALALLAQAVAAREEAALWLKVDPHFDSLRADPRFAELLQHAQLD